MLDQIINILYPRRCPICGGIVIPKKEKACIDCYESLKCIVEPRCKKCSKPIVNEEQEYCYDCGKKNYHYVKGYALWPYDQKMKRSLADYKYHNRKEYADFYVEEFLKIYALEIKRLEVDALIPVPIHRSKLKIRGYNQAEVLACKMGEQLGIKVISNMLLRNKKTLPQKGLSDKERLKNLSKAFLLDNEERKLYNDIKKVILVDDIYTTGSTIEACTNVLIQSGMKEVYYISLCIGKGF